MTIMSDLNMTTATTNNLGQPKGHLRGKSSKYSGLGGVDPTHLRQDTQDDNEFETFDLALQGKMSEEQQKTLGQQNNIFDTSSYGETAMKNMLAQAYKENL